MKDNILLIDGNSLLFRAYHASAYRGLFMKTSNGIPTNAVFGFAKMIQKAIDLMQPKHVMVAWDTGKPTFRHNQFDDYKGTRKEVDPELKVQFPIAREYLEAMQLFQYEEDGIEADDIIGSVSKKYKDEHVYILSSDKDLLQLIDDTTEVLLMKKGISELKVMDEKTLLEEMEVTPQQIIEMKALSGDSADNIPGVRGIGDKTAVKLLHTYQSVEGIYEHIEELKGKQKEKLLEDKEIAFMSKQLATIKIDCEFAFDLDALVFEKNISTLNTFFQKYEMHSLLSKEEVVVKEWKEYQVIHSLNDIQVEENMCITLDSDCENHYQTTLYGMMIHNSQGVYYMKKDYMLKDASLHKYLNSNIAKFTYDVKAMYHVLKRYGFICKPFTLDLMIASFLLDATLSNYDKFIAYYEHYEEKNKQDIYGKAGKPKIIDEEEKMKFLNEQIQMFYEVKEQISKEIDTKDLSYVLYEIEMPTSYILYTMEQEGVTVDVAVLDDIKEKTLAILQACEEKIHMHAKKQFNVNSVKQLSEVLFDELALRQIKKRSTAIDVLEKLRDDHPIIEELIVYRKYQKIYSTYAEGLKKHVLADGKIHTIFNQCLTQTGRLSSSEPNLQNLSVRDDEAKQVRKAFVASEGHVLFAADYSQIELRVLAHMAKDPKMIEAFTQGVDIHARTAMDLFGCSLEDVDSAMRRQAKIVNFGMVYGQGDFGLSEELHITRNEAKLFMQKYFESFPNIHSFMNETIQFCEESGYVKTLCNRRRYIPEIHDKNYMTREFGKRAAMNAPIQGSAADIIKLAMIHVYNALIQQGLQSKMILQIHDELVFDVVESEVEMVERIVVEAMEHAFDLVVPLVVDYSNGNNYYEVK